MIQNTVQNQWLMFGDVIINEDQDRVFDVSNLVFMRRKNNQLTTYQVIERIATGSFREIYEIHSMSAGKFKTIKLSFPDHSQSQRESSLIGVLNSDGRQTGISKPDKAFLTSPSCVQIQVMPKYHFSLLHYLVGDVEQDADLTELFKSSKLPEQVCIQILKQFASGLRYLQERSIYHGDIHLRNILCSLSVPIRFDLIDFEESIDLTKIHSLDMLFRQLSEQNTRVCKDLCAAHPGLSESKSLDLCKKWLLSQDALAFAMVLEDFGFVHLLKSELNSRLLQEIIELVNATESIDDDVFSKIQQMQESSELLSTVPYYAKSKYIDS